MSTEDHLYYLLKLIHYRLIKGFSLNNDYERAVVNIYDYSDILNISIILLPMTWGYLILESDQFMKQGNKLGLIDVENPPNYLVGHISGIPRQLLGHGNKYRITIESNIGRQIILFETKTNLPELMRVKRNVLLFSDFITYIDHSSHYMYIVHTDNF
jgi:hypothetical protein